MLLACYLAALSIGEVIAPERDGVGGGGWGGGGGGGKAGRGKMFGGVNPWCS